VLQAARLAILLILTAGPLVAQEGARPMRLRGLTLDHWFGPVGEALLRPTYRATALPRARPGFDLAVVMFPDAMSLHLPVLTAGLQFGVAHRVPLGPVAVLLKGGAAALVSAESGGNQPFHAIPGVHGGLGLLVPVDARSYLRADLTRHLYLSDGRELRMWSLGAGFSVVLGGRKR
jgi:hypothetical protein